MVCFERVIRAPMARRRLATRSRASDVGLPLAGVSGASSTAATRSGAGGSVADATRPGSGGPGVGVLAAARCTSATVTAPSGPVRVTVESPIPSSAASRRARGDERTLPVPPVRAATACSTSARVMAPSLPVPWILPVSTPSRCARCRTGGAIGGPAVGPTGSGGRGVRAAGFDGAPAGGAARTGAPTSAGVWVITASGVPTGTFADVDQELLDDAVLEDLDSMSALSVSTTATMSPR